MTKIRELFINENNGPNVLTFVIDTSTETNLNSSQIRQLKSWFDHVPGDIGNASVEVDREAIEIAFTNLSNTSEQFLNNLLEKVRSLIDDLLEKWGNMSIMGFSALVSHGVPSSPINWEVIKIVAKPGNTLKGIDKLIPTDCDELTIENCENITGNVLGLLKLSSYVELLSNNKNLKWIQIIDKHMGEGRDILKCQDELIEAGLKEYARL